MLVSLKWLEDYIDLELSAEELADRLTMAGLEVDEIQTLAPKFSGVVVAKILSVRPHPNADKLSLCDVTDGVETYPIVCGAKNIHAGDVVPLAKAGAVIPGGYTIKSTTLRGEKSEGMLCSEAELEIGDDASGILQMPADMALGRPLQEALDLGDTVLDIGITPNRSDCLSMIGIAREAAALTGKKMKMPDVKVRESAQDVSLLSSVTIEDADLCPRYTARLIQNVTIGGTPVWMKTRLEAAGLRAINNVVDVTNFVMLEMGQPLHAFDFRFLEEGRIVVRKSKPGEEFISLDEKSRLLPENTLLICDGKKPVAIAGIMGGLNSEVKEDTRTILLESAYFNPASIRRSSRRLGMPTDAAFRFERGIDPEGVVRALDRAAQLIAELSGGEVCRNYLDEYPAKIKAVENIPLRMDRVRQVIGARVPAREAVRILKSIGMALRREGKGAYRVTPPSFRVDIEREIDLIEEIARLYGYDRVPSTLPSVSVSEAETVPRLALEERIRQLMTGAGYSEIINYSFSSPDSAEALGLSPEDERRRFVVIKNPLTEDQSIMRTTLAYGLLETLKKNLHNASFNLKLFEIGRTFFKRHDGELPEEKNILAALAAGKAADDLWGSKVSVDFYDLKGSLENIFQDLKLDSCRCRTETSEPFLHPGQSCGVYIGDVRVGFLGKAHPEVLKKMDIRSDAYLFEINLDLLGKQTGRRIRYRELSKFPAVQRDVAFVVPESMESEKMLEIVLSQHEDLLENVSIFDIYSGKGLEERTKSLGLRFSYRALDRTLTDAEINSIHNRIVQNTVQQTGAKIRA
ncbi:MAG TPA: phenylalanine--tRNA ligase subunit beta [Smithellaceae bacterium]|jgi:phenylalanyl-tRNA synthetase beta chain|nr:phenylalanine--tRNA ligase subunit beta [Syntrophaceae bacterium]MBP9531449.1 phenylalanine--tRNA ligase subunit beta [Syntrophaceae bacterium]HPI51244.1 phenylalanine--tRNA ligase subunit beta [Smithellaceae bacterium]HPY06545.1 phenylalanine--tRNA ligase subunit beta [Smithellaceae bacterium]HQC10758.1 phenylalanine--tRNA ligase subunit beta [Smithellaceae bacterium]